jgi:glycosyltransferase involved in cell wall biosynthesis
LQEYDEKYPGLFKLILSPFNTGITANCNRVLAQCSGDYIAMIGGDDIWLPGKLHRQIEWLLKNPDAALCYTKAEMFESASGKTVALAPKNENSRNSPAGLGEFLKDPPLYVGSSLVLPRWAIPESAFDERVKWVSDWLFTLDILSKGRMGYIDDVLTRYRRHVDNISANMDLMFFDTMVACNLAEGKYPEYLQYLKDFRLGWILRYTNSKCLSDKTFSHIVKRGAVIFYNIVEDRLLTCFPKLGFKKRWGSFFS